MGYRSLSVALGRGLMSSGVKICYKTNLISPDQSLAYTAGNRVGNHNQICTDTCILQLFYCLVQMPVTSYEVLEIFIRP